LTRNGFKIDFVFFQIWSGWIPSSSRSGSSSSKLATPPIGPVPPPIGPAVVAAAEPISKDMKGIPEFDGRGGWNGAIGTRRCWMFPPVATGFPTDGKTTGGTANSFVMVVDVERKGNEIKVSRSVNWGFCFCLFTWIFRIYFSG